MFPLNATLCTSQDHRTVCIHGVWWNWVRKPGIGVGYRLRLSTRKLFNSGLPSSVRILELLHHTQKGHESAHSLEGDVTQRHV